MPSADALTGANLSHTSFIMKKILAFLLLPACLFGQTLPDSTIKKIDSVFRAFDSTSPGYAVAIMQKGEVIFQKGYGMANLEYAAPITPNTIFHIASESKQYVAFCMLLLEKEGKLSIDDDIRKYLDYVPDFGYKITIRHLIHHTSGLRDQWQLLANAGWQLDDVITQEHVIKLVSKQKALNAIPGEEFNYCNTGYTLMAEIVKKVSGLTLRQYCDKNIFQPLGMKDTHFHDNYQELVPGRAYSYIQTGAKKYVHAVLSYSIVGATSLFTTVSDELKWVHNYETGQVGGKELIEKMYQTGVLNDGRKLDYAFAVAVDKYKGWKRIGHGGADAGYRTYVCRFPEKEIAIAVFSNLGSTNPNDMSGKVASILFPEKPAEPASPSSANIAYADSNLLKKLPGNYISTKGQTLKLTWREGKLMASIPATAPAREWKLIVKGNNRLEAENQNQTFVLNAPADRMDSIRSFGLASLNDAHQFKRLPSDPQKIGAEFNGKYFSDEVEAFYTITETNGQLKMEHRKFNTVPLKYIGPDQFTLPYWWMSHIRFLRDTKGKIVAFEVNAGRIQKLRYDKVK